MAHLDVSKNGSKTSRQAFTSLTGNAHMETAHLKKGFSCSVEMTVILGINLITRNIFITIISGDFSRAVKKHP